MDAGKTCEGVRQEEQPARPSAGEMHYDGEKAEQPASAEMDASLACEGMKEQEQPVCRRGDDDDEENKKSEDAWNVGMQSDWQEQCER